MIFGDERFALAQDTPAMVWNASRWSEGRKEKERPDEQEENPGHQQIARLWSQGAVLGNSVCGFASSHIF